VGRVWGVGGVKNTKRNMPFSEAPSHAEAWVPSDYHWDDVRMMAWRQKSTGVSDGDGAAESKCGLRPSARPAPVIRCGVLPAERILACRIDGCPGICDKAYTARSRVCLEHMQAGERTRIP
jgi:hypothetical protein